MRALVGRAGRDVDRHVADQPHAARRGVRAQRSPLALEAHLVGQRAAPAEALPVARPRPRALGEVQLLGARHPRPRLRQQPGPGRERRARLVGRAVAVRRTQRQHLPPALPRVREPVHPGVRFRAEPAAGERGRVQLHAAGASEVHEAAMSDTHAGMPAAKRREPPKRIRIRPLEPVVDAGRYAPKRCVGDTVTVAADVFGDGHEILRAVVRYKAPGGRAGWSAEMHPVDAHYNGVRWEGQFTPETPGQWQFAVEAWIDTFATWRDELQRKVGAGQDDLAGELSEGRVLLEQRSSARRTQTTSARSRRRSTSSRTGRPARPSSTPRSRPSSTRRSSACRSATARPGSTRRCRSRSTASARASAPGTSWRRAPGAA